jgi:hypothetical protein
MSQLSGSERVRVSKYDYSGIGRQRGGWWALAGGMLFVIGSLVALVLLLVFAAARAKAVHIH